MDSLSMAQFQFLVERSDEEVTLVRQDGRFAWCNLAAAESLGYTRAEFLELAVKDVDVDIGPGWREHVDAMFRSEHGLHFHTTQVTKDGRPVRKEFRSTRLTLDGTVYLCGLAHQVGAPHRSAAELRQVSHLYGLLSRINQAVVGVTEREQLFREVCEAAIEFDFRMAWVGVLDDRDGSVRVAASAGHVDGYLDSVDVNVREEARSRGPTGVAVREGRLDVCADLRAEARMKPWLERALSRGYLASAAVPLRERGRVIGALNLYAGEPGFFSERECQLVRQIGDDVTHALDGLAAASESDRLRAQLEQARRLEAIGRIAGGVAHDFNNLLTVILGGLDVALEDPALNADSRELLEESRDAAVRSVELARQLLTFARKQRAAPQVLDLNDCVEGSLKLLRRFVGAETALTFTPSRPLPPVRVDPTQLSQVLMNLCLNARDALRPGGGIRVSTASLALDAVEAARRGMVSGPVVQLAVDDDGCGMPPEVQARLFEPFFTTKDLGQGTGLGLSTVYGIVKQCGGHISVESVVGRGTTFTVTLPSADGQVAPAPAAR